MADTQALFTSIVTGSSSGTPSARDIYQPLIGQNSPIALAATSASDVTGVPRELVLTDWASLQTNKVAGAETYAQIYGRMQQDADFMAKANAFMTSQNLAQLPQQYNNNPQLNIFIAGYQARENLNALGYTQNADHKFQLNMPQQQNNLQVNGGLNDPAKIQEAAQKLFLMQSVGTSETKMAAQTANKLWDNRNLSIADLQKQGINTPSSLQQNPAATISQITAPAAQAVQGIDEEERASEAQAQRLAMAALAAALGGSEAAGASSAGVFGDAGTEAAPTGNLGRRLGGRFGGMAPRVGGGHSNIPGGKDKMAPLIFGKLKKLGYTDNAAAAAMGNMWQESSFNPEAKGKAGEFGLCQWLANRRVAVVSYAGGPGNTNWEKQVEFFDQEMAKVDPSFKNSTESVGVLTPRMERVFEKPQSLADAGTRTGFARVILDKYGGDKYLSIKPDAIPEPGSSHGPIMAANPHYDAATLAEMPEGVQHILASVERHLGSQDYKHCWDWAQQVYDGAHVSRETVWPPDAGGITYTDYGHDFRQSPHYSAATNKELKGMLRPGDWIFVNNRNGADAHGNHSAIFVGWDKNGRALLASGPNPKTTPANVRAFDLDAMPITYIGRAAGTGVDAHAIPSANGRRSMELRNAKLKPDSDHHDKSQIAQNVSTNGRGKLAVEARASTLSS